MSGKHLKRLAAPRTWSIPKKVARWAPKPSPGPHAAEASVPLVLVLRDYLRVCDTAREARRILGAREVLVDQRVATDPKRGLGLMDVLTIPKLEASWRVLVDTRGRLGLAEVPKGQAAWKLCRLEDKSTVVRGRTQLHLHDGRNILLKEPLYRTGDVLKVKLPDQQVVEHYAMAEGAPAYVTGGAHVGEVARIVRVEVTRRAAANLVYLRDGGAEFSTIKPYVFVVGKEAPEVEVPERLVTGARPLGVA